MTIWAYLMVGLMIAANGWLTDISSTNPMRLWIRIVLSVLFCLLWPLTLIENIAFAVWCRVKPEHRIHIEIVEKKD